MDVLVSAKEIYDTVTQESLAYKGKKYFIVERRKDTGNNYDYFTVIPWDKRNKKPYKQEDLMEIKVKIRNEI